jgi:hypothetical protein
MTLNRRERSVKESMWRVAAAAVVVAGSAAGSASADPRLDEVVYSPYVENHVLEVETRVGQELGAGDLANARTTVVELEAGLNDRASLALVTSITRAPGASDRLTRVGLEGVYYLGQIPGTGVDTAAYLEVAKGIGGETNGLEGKLLLAKTAGRFQGLLNLIVERPLGAPAGEDFASYGYAASATWRTVGHLRLGVEAFGDFGDDHGFLNGRQGAYVGPQVKWEGRPRGAPVEIEVDAGWLAAVGPDRQEAASQARINVELERRF